MASSDDQKEKMVPAGARRPLPPTERCRLLPAAWPHLPPPARECVAACSEAGVALERPLGRRNLSFPPRRAQWQGDCWEGATAGPFLPSYTCFDTPSGLRQGLQGLISARAKMMHMKKGTKCPTSFKQSLGPLLLSHRIAGVPGSVISTLPLGPDPASDRQEQLAGRSTGQGRR